MTVDPLAVQLRTGAQHDLASRRAAVELLIGADGGVLLGVHPVRNAIVVHSGGATVGWAALHELGCAAAGDPRPDQVADVMALFRAGVGPRTLVNIAQLGLMEWDQPAGLVGPEQVDAWLSAAFATAADHQRFLRTRGG
jgi:hypothetical protein